MIELYSLPDCARAVRLFLDRAPQRADGFGPRLAKAVSQACAQLTRDPRSAGPEVVLDLLRESGPLDETQLASARRVSAAWAQHWAVRGIITGAWQMVVREGQPAGALVFRSDDGLTTVRAHLHVQRMSDPAAEVVIIFRVGRVPQTEREQTAASAQLEVIRAAVPAALSRQVYLAEQAEYAAPRDIATAAYARMIRDAQARASACDLDALTPPRVEQLACKRCRMQEACAR